MALTQEIDITLFVEQFLLTGQATDFSCSQAERGSYSGEGSFNHAKETTEVCSIVNDETREILKTYFSEFGAWDREEIQNLDDTELNALCLQWIASEYKEHGINEESTIFKTEGKYFYYFGY